MEAPAVDPQTLMAARQLLRDGGLAGMSMERVARAAGVSRVTLHRHGVTRDAILGALVAESVESYRRAVWPVLTADAPARERLELALRVLVDQAEQHLEVLVAMRAQSDAIFHAEPDDDADGTLTRDVFTQPLERILRDAVTEGTVDVPDPTVTATVLFNLVGWTYVHLRTGHGWSPGRSADEVLGVALHGVLRSP